MWFVTAAALAVEPAPIPPPQGLPPTLFDRTALFDVKATTDTPTCEAALKAVVTKAMEMGEKDGLKTIIAYYPAEGLAQPPLTHVPCKLTGIPDAPSGATAEVKVLMVRPGYGFPNVPASRQAELIGLLTAVHQIDPNELGLVYEAGQVWVYAGVREHAAVLPVEMAVNARGVAALQEHVIPWVTRWAPVTTQAPEVAGAVLGVRVRSEAEKGKRKEVFSFRADAQTAAAFTTGRISDEDWVAKLPVTVVDEGAKKAITKPLQLDLASASGSITAGKREGLGGDLSDLEDL